MTLLLSLAAFYAAMMILRYGRRGVLAIAPSLVASRPAPGGGSTTAAQHAAIETLEPLGFRRLGGRVEEGPLRGLVLPSELLAGPDGATFADLFEEGSRPDDVARVQLLSVFPDGAVLLTANHSRDPRSGSRGEVTALPGAPLQEVVEVHASRRERMAALRGAALPAIDLAGRDAAAQAWYRGLGGSELRRRFAVYLANSLFAAAVLTYCIHALARGRLAP